MFTKILIANRGEIACRVIRTAKKMGIRTVAVYSDADADALHVTLADEAVHIGGAAPADSYLNIARVFEAALSTGAQAIHPGYGFLSENAAFAEGCTQHNITFIGPPIGAIASMGSKSAAKQLMEPAGVPMLPGYHGKDQNPDRLKEAAENIGYPVLLKAVSGGGGKGMRQVDSANVFDEALAAARREAQSSFGDDAMLVEKFLASPRHVEIQIFCDMHGAGVYLFERDCSVQRRHQKIIEEAPAPGITEALRAQMGEAALRAANAVSYVGAGTVEFLLDEDDKFYFMEMNTRLQVEHPVTEMITGLDLVEWQLKVANGESLPCEQSALSINGHAFEARIYAEDPDREFLPAVGTINWMQQPTENSHVRIDTGVIEGDEVGVYYDPMIAKLIVWGETRHQALDRLAQALTSFKIVGVTTNIDFLLRLATHRAFIAEEVSTNFIAHHHADLFPQTNSTNPSLLVLAALYLAIETQSDTNGTSPWHAKDYWRMNAPGKHPVDIISAGEHIRFFVTHTEGDSFTLEYDENVYQVKGCLDGHQLVATLDGHKTSNTVVDLPQGITLFAEAGTLHFARATPDLGEDISHDDGMGFKAPMNGTVVQILVSAGDEVIAGDTLVIMEAMKMEHAIKAPAAGKIVEIYFHPGDLVDGGQELIGFEPASG